MRFGNPAVRRMVRQSDGGALYSDGQTATYRGVYLKAALYAALTIITAVGCELGLFKAISDGYIAQALTVIGIAAGVSLIPLLILAFVIAFVPSTAKVLGCIYAILQGALLGLLSLCCDLVFPGIAFAAFLGTAIVFLVAIVVNSVFKTRISSRFVRGLMVAMGSLLFVQLIMWIMSLFNVFDYTAFIWLQLGISALCVIWATVMLFWDLQNIDYIVQSGADKKYEWNVAFSLVTTLIYMYVEILELLVRIMALFSRNKN